MGSPRARRVEVDVTEALNSTRTGRTARRKRRRVQDTSSWLHIPAAALQRWRSAARLSGPSLQTASTRWPSNPCSLGERLLCAPRSLRGVFAALEAAGHAGPHRLVSRRK